MIGIILTSLQALVITCTSLFTYDVHLGMGKHVWDVPSEQLSYTIMINLICHPLGVMAFSFPNISVVILIERLMPPNIVRTIGLYTVATLQCLAAAVGSTLLFVQCTPSAHLWDPTIPAKCVPHGTISRYCYFVGCM
jgi:hypothetical protein